MCLLLPLVSTLVFSRIGSVLSHLNSLTHRILRRFRLRNCTSSSRLLRFFLSLQQRTQPAVEFLSYKNSQNRESFMQRLRTSAQEPLISFCTVQIRSLCTSRFLVPLCLSTYSGPGPGELPGFWGSMVFHHAPFVGRDRLKTRNYNTFHVMRELQIKTFLGMDCTQ